MINEEDIKHYFSDNLWKAMSKNEKKRFTDLKIIINTKDIEVKEEPTQVEESIDDVRVHADILKNEMQVTSEFDETDDSKLLEIGECKVSCNEVLRTCEGDDGVESEERSTEELQFVNSENVRGEPAKDDGKKYSCSQCAYKSDLKCSYEFHLYEHSACSKFVYLGQEFLRCNLCKFAYKTESSMQNHIMVKHKKHGCSMCAYKTNCSWEMAQHTAVHSGEVSLISVRLCECSKRFVCVHCGYKANNKTRLTAHMESKHINEKNFKCFYCDFTSNYRRSLSVHLTTHYSVNNRKLFKCSKCNYQTNGPARLKNHRNNKHGSVKKYRCSSCDYGTNIISHMNKHLATHEQTRPYECDVCKRRFKRNYLLKGHSLMHMGEKKKFDNKRTTKKRD